jgi:hypothetical protein
MEANRPSAGLIPNADPVNFIVARAIKIMGNMGSRLTGLMEQSSGASIIPIEERIASMEISMPFS